MSIKIKIRYLGQLLGLAAAFVVVLGMVDTPSSFATHTNETTPADKFRKTKAIINGIAPSLSGAYRQPSMTLPGALIIATLHIYPFQLLYHQRVGYRAVTVSAALEEVTSELRLEIEKQAPDTPGV